MNERDQYTKYLLNFTKESKLKNKSSEELKQMYLKKQLIEILEKKGINTKKKTYTELKSEYDKYINNNYIESKINGTDKNNKLELTKDITNKLWLEIFE